MRQTLLVVALSALSLAASAQGPAPPVRGAGPAAMATRSVSRYLDLERALAAALHERRRDAVLQTLAPDFEVRSGEALDALSAADWLAGQWRTGAPALRVRDVAVRELGDVAVVSFLLDAAPPGRRPTTLYVVDVWQQATDKLAARYVTQPLRPLPAPARPRGRE